MNTDYANFFELNGKIIKEINHDGDRIVTADQYVYILGHIQDCCEHVRQVHTIGNPQSLIGNTITLAEEDVCDDPAWWGSGYGYNDSHTWTVFTLVDDKNNRVEFYWLGESNGCYSEDVTVTKSKIQ